MQKDIRQEELLSPEIQETMRSVVSAIRAVRLYPPNNPVYSNSVKKSFEELNRFLQTGEEYHIGVHKNHFSFKNTPFGKDNDLNKPIVQDLFVKEIREIVFLKGLTEPELLQFYQTLALNAEECKMKGGIFSILWEKGLSHIKVIEAGLDEVITTPVTHDQEKKEYTDKNEQPVLKKTTGFPGRTLVLDNLATDPDGFSANMIELAKQTKADQETMEDRLFALYKEAGKKIDEQQESSPETLYEGMAKSVLALDSRYRNGFIADKLYGELDAEIANKEDPIADQNLPSAHHEVQTGRFSDSWTVQQIATLLKKAAFKQPDTSPLPSHPASFQGTPVDDDLIAIAKEMTKYSPEDMEELQALSNVGNEMDTMRSYVQTLIALMPLVKNHRNINSEDNDITSFSGIIKQIENALEYFLKNKNYEISIQIVKALNLPMEAAFQPIAHEALKKAAAKSYIIAAMEELRKYPNDSVQYRSAYTYLTVFELESTEILLELLAEEKDKKARIFYLALVKDIGKNQVALFVKHLSDIRWYFVRNIVNILSESKTDQAITFLKRVAQHKDIRIRQEVIHGLISIGGKKAAGVLYTFLEDKDGEIKKLALQAFSSFPDIGAGEAKPLIDFLDKQQLNKKEQDFTLEAIKALGKIGDNNSGIFLKRYDRIRWWKSRKLQKELRSAARRAIEEISRRHG